MREVTLSIPEKTRGFLQDVIARAGGNEVFFLGRVAWGTGGGLPAATLEEVDVLARGNQGAVPAILRRAEEWDLALHNHPSGLLTPSDPDLAVAGELSSMGVGFAIISNDASRHYLVVNPFQRRRDEPVDLEEVRRLFALDGPLASGLHGFEPRQGQLDMALEVGRALNESRVLAAEAGTGVGKSFAYLVPAILWAARNRRRVIVATHTINLQEQLIGKDLPFLAGVLPAPFRYALSKGRGNYACRRKVEELEQALGAPELIEDRSGERRHLRRLVEWANTTRDGSRADLAWMPPADLWEMVMSEADKSLHVSCPHYEQCFFYQARDQARDAHLVVANHHLFFADLAVRRETTNYHQNAVLPAYDRVIFDEAHHLEDVATEYFGARFSRLGIRARLARLISPRDPSRGAIPTLCRRLEGAGDPLAARSIERTFAATLPEVRERVEGHFQEIDDRIAARERAAPSPWESAGAPAGGEPEGGAPGLLADGGAAAGGAEEPLPEGGPGEEKVRYRADGPDGELWSFVAAKLDEARRELEILLRVNERALESLQLSSAPFEEVQRLSLELTSFDSRLLALLRGMVRFADFADRSQVCWVSRRERRRDREETFLEFATAPIRIDSVLREAVFEPLKTVVLTSATLSAGSGIDYLAERLGLAGLDAKRFRFASYPSPFDFRRQVLTVAPADLPPPQSGRYAERLPEAICRLLEATDGRAFVLFTSYSLLRRTYAVLQGRLRALGLRPVAQGEAGRSEILERFKSGVHNVLFGTDSFWEGVDVKGRALESVIITRLPFRVPSEPIQEARLEDLEARGFDAFKCFTVPQAVLKFKQGFGRLIRSRSDRGIVAVLDPRILSKPYGRVFLASLPETTLLKAPLETALEAVRGFFAGTAAGGQGAPGAFPPPPSAGAVQAGGCSPGGSRELDGPPW